MNRAVRGADLVSLRFLYPGLCALLGFLGLCSFTHAEIVDLASMQVARQGLGGGVDSAGLVYALGGLGRGLSPLYSSMERWDPASNSWSYLSPMSTGRDFFGCVFGGDGRLYAIGGGSAASMSRAEVYHPATDAWAAIAGLPEPRSSLSAAVDGLGRVYAMGGTAAWPNPSDKAWRYNLITDVWESVAHMNVARMRFATATDSQGRIYAIGTSSPAGEPHGIGASVERYDPLTDTWTLLAPLPSARTGAAAAYAGADNAIYVFGGWQPGFTNEILRYDIASDTWSWWGQMTYAKNNLAAVPSRDGNVYFFGGEGPGIHEARADMQKLVVPEPVTAASAVIGLCSLAAYLRRRANVPAAGV